MKIAIIYLIIISFLFQSCYSYKTIDLKDSSLVVGKNYKIRQDTKFVKSKLELVNDSTITVKEGKIRKDVSISKIKEIKESKFSTLKTVGLVLGIGLVIVGVIGVSVVDSYDENFQM
ncbi:hypothetical protein [Flavobacterium granuli]|uniref:Membrane protein n=1 Tax=Flavobacterium granuli TaxID=280093 RepID=A0ABU1S4F6_9FLAO|nr:hypothetical protein [Flavobacterium granuli]MDR6845926.1 putative membrane protein [Flavobacterium granuli]